MPQTIPSIAELLIESDIDKLRGELQLALQLAASESRLAADYLGRAVVAEADARIARDERDVALRRLETLGGAR